MPPRPRSNGPTLPKQLREELGLTDIYGAKKMKQNGPASRKERRKAERREKKAARRPINNRSSREDDDDDDDDDDDIEEQIDSDISSDEEESESTKTTKKPKSILKKPKPTAADEGSEPKPARQIPKSVQEKLAEDDAEIAALERKLGIRGRKKLPKIFEKEGLAELLGDLDADSEEESRKRKRENDEWLQRKRRKAQGLPSEDEEESEEELGSEDDILDESEGDDMDDIDEDLDVDVDGEDDEFAGFDDEDEGDEEEEVDEEEEGEEEEDEDEDEEKQEKKSPPKKVRENPYVPPVVNGDSSRTKYVPPSLRAPSASESENEVRLRRQAQGLLNKLSESNLISILGEVEKLYREYPRQSVTSTLTTLLLGLICDRTALQDTFIILHAGFIAAIYKIIGMDFGAEFIQRLVETFDKNGDERGSFEGKEPINLMSLLSQLYNLHVIGSNLVFDYIRLFLQEITETNTEYLLKIIRNSGPQLRQDDPSALKDIVLLIQPAVARVGEEALSVRTKFMIETITDLKNNRMKTGVAASSLASEHLTKMRKILGSLNNRNVRATEPIRISRSDIHNAEKKGKWWLVGASWKDDPLEAARQELSAAGLPSAPVAAPTIEDSDGEPDLVNIAKAHRMNTDVRRAIFVAIMSATDYRDAHVRLLKLHLKRNQEYEIPRVLVHCAMEEDAYNPYYTLIARRVCSEGGRRLRKSFEFTLWDVFKRMGERGDLDDDDDSDAFNGFDEDDEDGNNQKLTTKSIVNLAKMYASLVADGTLTLSILKNLNFAYLQPKTSTFIEVLIITIFQQTQAKGKSKQKKKEKKKKKEKEENTDDEDRDEKPIARIFDRTHDAAPQIVKGLIYFLRKVVAKTDIVSSAKDRKLVKWGCRVALDALRDGSA